MKKIIFLLLVVATLPALAADSLGTKLYDKFAAAFPDARNVRWYPDGELTAVSYESEGIISHIWYDSNGDVVKTRRYYTEKDLAPFLKVKINQKYAGKSIYGVTEVSDKEGLFYVLMLQDDKKWYQVRCEAGGETTLLQKYKKS